MSPAIREGGRVRLTDEPAVVGTVIKLNQKTAVVRIDGYEGTNTYKLDWLEPKRGRTPGTIAPDFDEPAPLGFKCVLEEAVRNRCDELGMSLNQLAGRANVSRSTLGRLLAEGPDGTLVSTIEALAGALGLTPSDFWILKPRRKSTRSTLG